MYQWESTSAWPHKAKTCTCFNVTSIMENVFQQFLKILQTKVATL